MTTPETGTQHISSTRDWKTISFIYNIQSFVITLRQELGRGWGGLSAHLPSDSSLRRTPSFSRQSSPCVHMPIPGSKSAPLFFCFEALIDASAAIVTRSPMRPRQAAVANPRFINSTRNIKNTTAVLNSRRFHAQPDACRLGGENYVVSLN